MNMEQLSTQRKRRRLGENKNKKRTRLKSRGSAYDADAEDTPPELRKQIRERSEHGKVKKVETPGDRMIRFAQTLRVPDGKDVGKPVVLRDWQINIVKDIYDPVDPVTHLRSVREAIFSLARKNSKTTMASFLLLGHIIGPEAIRNSQCYSAAFERDQAALAWKSCANMVSQDEELTYYLSFHETHKQIRCPMLGTTYKALSSETKSKHGLNAVFVLMDELAQFGADSRLYNTLKTSQGAYDEPLLIVASTQAADDGAVLSELIDYGLQLEEGSIEPDPSFKLFLYTLDKKDENDKEIDIFDEKNWYKANPALGDFRSLQDMRDLSKRAKKSPTFEMSFRNLYLNQRVANVVGFISFKTWENCGGVVPVEELAGMVCYAGLDLSKKQDLTALVLYFPKQDDLEYNVLLPWFWTPEDLVEDHMKTDKAPYDKWIERGYLIALPGKKITYQQPAQTLLECKAFYDLQSVAFDRWRIEDFKTALNEIDEGEAQDLLMVPFSQGARDMDPAIDDFETLLVEGNLRHGNHPVLTWNASSTRVHKNHTDQRRFEKVRENCRIDGMVASAMAIRMSNITPENTGSGYNQNELVVAGA